jgi:6-phosphogluconolactonase
MPTGSSGSAGAGVGGASGVAGAAGGTNMAGTSSSGGSASLNGTPLVFVGGFGSDPILTYELNKTTGALTPHGEPTDAGSMPSCLAVDAARAHLYVCNEDGGEAGGLTAFSIGSAGALTKLNHRSGSQQGFTALSISPNGKLIAGADYDGGSASTFSLMADGSLGNETGAAVFSEGAQSHYVAFDPSGKYLLVTTKGARAMQQLLVDEAGKLTPNAPPSVAAEPGTAPRHMTVHPNGKLVYVVNEAGSSITTYQWAADGKLTRGVTISSTPADYNGSNTGAHIELSPDAKFLYVSNRGHDSIGVFSVNQDTGALGLVEHEASRGSAPHDFDIDPNGDVLIAVNRKSSSLAVFRRAADGTLSPLGDVVPTRADPTSVLITYPK